MKSLKSIGFTTFKSSGNGNPFNKLEFRKLIASNYLKGTSIPSDFEYENNSNGLYLVHTTNGLRRTIPILDYSTREKLNIISETSLKFGNLENLTFSLSRLKKRELKHF